MPNFPAVRPIARPFRPFAAWLVAGLALLLAACGSLSHQRTQLDRAQYDFSAAVRWGDFQSALNMVDPEVRKTNPISDVEFSRYSQVQVTAYREVSSVAGADDTAIREVEIDLVNRNTLAQRSVRYVERWRYDAASKRWWVVSGLPDFWQGR